MKTAFLLFPKLPFPRLPKSVDKGGGGKIVNGRKEKIFVGNKNLRQVHDFSLKNRAGKSKRWICFYIALKNFKKKKLQY